MIGWIIQPECYSIACELFLFCAIVVSVKVLLGFVSLVLAPNSLMFGLRKQPLNSSVDRAPQWYIMCATVALSSFGLHILRFVRGRGSCRAAWRGH